MLKVARGVARYTPNGVVLVSVDPGKHVCGVAVWQDVVLLRAFLVKAPFGDSYGEMKYAPQRWVSLAGDVRDTVEEVCAAAGEPLASFHPEEERYLLLERMQVYAKDGAEKADDLLDLMGVAGAIAGALPSFLGESVLPSAWKGQVPREVLAERERLKWLVPGGKVDPRLVLPRDKKTQADVLAAVSLGRWWFKNHTSKEVR